MDSYDSWKLENAEDEDERINGCARRRLARQEYIADHCDDFLERERERKGIGNGDHTE